MILALVNNKGGVGKTTTAVNLAAALASKKRPLLLVDLDSQGSASFSLGIPRAGLRPSMADVLLESEPLRRAIHETKVEGLDVATGSMELASADLSLADERGRESLLRGYLKTVKNDYRVILLDCPPSLGLITVNALTSADAFVVPIVPEYLALEGLVNLMDGVERIRKGIGRVAEFLGVLLVRRGYQTRSMKDFGDELRSHYGSKVLKTEIGQDTRLTEAPAHGMTIFEYAPTSAGAVAYRHLAAEILRRTKEIRR